MENKTFPMRCRERNSDEEFLNTLLPNLCEKSLMAIRLRFWENLLIEEIAQKLDLSWDETNKLIENSIKELRNGFLKNQMSARLLAA